MTTPPSDALIGHTGFVGGALLRARPFDALFNSSNIESMARRRFRLVVCAGAPAEKWKANAHPDADRANLWRLMGVLESVEADRFVLISTVDVYPEPRGVDEATDIPDGGQPYGRHRRELEEFVRRTFDATIVRLPGLYGRGLKKNAIYDLLHGNQVERIDSRGVFQFYPIDRLWPDIETALASHLDVVNLPTEPVSIAEIASEAFGQPFENALPTTPASYDVHTRHASSFGGRGPYVEARGEVLTGIARFVREERAR